MSPTNAAPNRWTRRRLLLTAFGGVAAFVGAGVTGVELISHGVVPGKLALDELEGACSVPAPTLRFTGTGISRSGSFYSSARHRHVGYTIAWPPGHPPGSPLPLIVMLHGYGANHSNALSSMTPVQAVSLEVDGQPLPPMAMVTVDGGGRYWNPHPGDDPMAMVISELIPMCQGLNLGRSPLRIGTMGISMGGYGALLFAEKYPELIRAVAAISPAIWTTYDQTRQRTVGLLRLHRPSLQPMSSLMRQNFQTLRSGSHRATMTRFILESYLSPRSFLEKRQLSCPRGVIPAPSSCHRSCPR